MYYIRSPRFAIAFVTPNPSASVVIYYYVVPIKYRTHIYRVGLRVNRFSNFQVLRELKFAAVAVF